MATNWGGNIISGMGYGAAAGGTAFGPYGALAGGILGGLTGVFTSIMEDNDAKERQRKLETLASKLGTSYDEIYKAYQDFYSQNSPSGTKEDADLAAQKIREFNPANYDWLDADNNGIIDESEKEAAKFDYDKNVEDFLNPYMDDVIDYTAKQSRHSAGGALLGRSTGASEAVARSVAKQTDELYNTALRAYESDRDFQYKQWADYNNAMKDRLKGLMEADQWQIGQLGQLGQDALNWQSQAFQAGQDIKQNKANMEAQLGLAGL